MKKIMMFSLMAALIFIVCGVLDADQSSASKPGEPNIPVAYLKENRFEFGVVKDGTEVNHAFIIANKGQAPLLIEKVKSGCGCTAVDYTREIPPGAEGRIIIKANTTGYQGQEFSKTILVETNDPKHRVLTLFITGTIN
jgi:hypothetical protein